MNSRNTLLTAAIAAAVGAGMSATSLPAQAAKMEKCYGIAKVKMNDCGNARHSCAGQSAKDGQYDEWVFVPKGTCNKIVGGNLKPIKPESITTKEA